MIPDVALPHPVEGGMAEINFPLNQLRANQPQLADTYERAIREAIGAHRGRYDVRILREPWGVHVQVEQPAFQTDAAAEVKGKKLIGKQARAWTWSAPRKAQTPEEVRDALERVLAERVRGRDPLRPPLRRRERPTFKSKHRR
jgi:hypothetical protein